MSGFDADWLRQREPFDLAARNDALASRFRVALKGRAQGPVRIVDLAAGSGANFRALAPLLMGDQDWLLVDHDPLLLAAQRAEIACWAARHAWPCREIEGGLLIEAEAARWHVRGCRLDLALSLEELDLAQFDGVTTTAFLDLVSAAWLDRFGALLARSGLPLLATLTVDGRREWCPALPVDGRVHEAFLSHQAGDKGFGGSLGGRAAACLADRLVAQGHEVSTARSDWQIGAEHGDMLLKMLDEATAVACEAEPASSPLFAGWRAERSAQLRSGQLSMAVGHIDLLALPAAG